MNPFPAVYHNTLGYDFQFSFWLTGYRCPCSTTGDINFINAQYWPSAVSLVLNGITETIVQCFLIYRYWRMSVIFVFITRSTIPSKICIGAKTIMSHLYWSYLCSQQCVNPTLGLQCVLILIMQSGGYIAASATLLQVPSTGNGHWVTLSALCVSFHYFWDTLIRVHVFRIWFSTMVATDVAITLVLLWQFYQIKSSFKTTMRCVSYHCWAHGYSHVVQPHS